MKAIVTRYHGPTATRPARVTAQDADRNRVSVPHDSTTYPHIEDAHDAAAVALCHKMDWDGTLVRGWLSAGVYAYCFTCGGQGSTPALLAIPLRSSVNTEAMEAAVRGAARKILGFTASRCRTIYEHGHWWVEDAKTGAQWSVVDSSGGISVFGFDFEQVTKGDES